MEVPLLQWLAGFEALIWCVKICPFNMTTRNSQVLHKRDLVWPFDKNQRMLGYNRHGLSVIYQRQPLNFLSAWLKCFGYANTWHAVYLVKQSLVKQSLFGKFHQPVWRKELEYFVLKPLSLFTLHCYTGTLAYWLQLTLVSRTRTRVKELVYIQNWHKRSINY